MSQVDRRVRGGPGQFLRHPSAKAAETRVLGYATTHKSSLNHAVVVFADLAALPSPYGFRLSRRPVRRSSAGQLIAQTKMPSCRPRCE